MKKKIWLCILLVATLACQVASPAVVSPTLPPSTPTSVVPPATSTPEREATPLPLPSETATTLPASPTETPAPANLPVFNIDWSKPFYDAAQGTPSQAEAWNPSPYAGEQIPLPLSLSRLANPHVLDGLTGEQRAFLVRNGFVVIHSQEAQFSDIRVDTATRLGQPYYLTTDVAFHNLHLLFDDMLKALEIGQLRPQMIAIVRAALEEVKASIPEVQGTSLEADAHQAVAYLSVALKLFDSQQDVDASVADVVSRQVDQILAAGGRDYSVLFPDFEDDYGAYKPVGHYAGDPELESYFRAMTWLGRTHFRLAEPENPAFVPSRLPLVVTLALRRAQVEGGPASDSWAEIHRILTFVVGPTDDGGPLEYAALMDAVYGERVTYQDLADEARWQEFLSRSAELPAPQVNSLFVTSTQDLAPERGWRFMGQRFTLDASIFQNVIYDRVEDKPDGSRRQLPSGLDVMAAFGSSLASRELEAQGITAFPGYEEQMTKMQQAVAQRSAAQWTGRFYDGWLYSFFPLLQLKDATFPAYMQTEAWGYKDLNTTLGSWAELKHDTILYTKTAEGAGGGGPPMSGPAPSYVEPNPLAFYRMAAIAQTLSCGLQDLVLHEGVCDPESGGYGSYSLGMVDYIFAMNGLAQHFRSLGDIAAKELAGQPLTDDELYAITGCLGGIECVNEATAYHLPEGEMPKVPVVAAVAGAENSVLEVGVGQVDRIYVAVPLEGKWEIAQGGVFSYYEFQQPRDQRLTDDEWRAKLATSEATLPAWASNFVLSGGKATPWLSFRIGDVYIVTEAGDQLNVRDRPSIDGNVLMQLTPFTYLTIVDGPVQANGHTWWKFEIFSWNGEANPTGWAVEDQQWYMRSTILGE